MMAISCLITPPRTAAAGMSVTVIVMVTPPVIVIELDMAGGVQDDAVPRCETLHQPAAREQYIAAAEQSSSEGPSGRTEAQLCTTLRWCGAVRCGLLSPRQQRLDTPVPVHTHHVH